MLPTTSKNAESGDGLSTSNPAPHMMPASERACGGSRGSSRAKKITLPIGTLGQSVELSVPWHDLSHDEFIINAPRVDIAGYLVPALGGIPLFSKIGQGGMGAVYYGIHRGFAEEVAVKVLPFHLAQTQPELIARFFREARIAAKIHSNHLVRVTNVGQEGNLSFLVMEYVTGKAASDILEIGRQGGAQGLDEPMMLDICIAACTGLAAAHDANVVHRDIKPDNILVPQSKDGRGYDFKAAKLSDLGLARCEGLHNTVTEANVCMGSPGYMAPEQIEDMRHAGKPADVFSLGATIYMLLCGIAPFTGKTSLAVLRATKQSQHTPLRIRRSDVSNPITDIVNICLAKDPENRFADGTALLKALVACRAALEKGQALAATETANTVEKPLENKRILTLSERPTDKLTITAREPAAASEFKTGRPQSSSFGAWVAAGIAAIAMLVFSAYVYISKTTTTNFTPELDPTTLDAQENASDARATERDRMRKAESESYAQKAETLKSAGIEAEKKRKIQQNAARLEFEKWLTQSKGAVANGDWPQAEEFYEKARGSAGLEFSTRKGELAEVKDAFDARSKNTGIEQKYRDILASIQRTVAAEPLDDFGHCYMLDAKRRAQIDSSMREAENIHADTAGTLNLERAKLSLDAALDLGGGGNIELMLVPPGEFVMGSKVWVPESGSDVEHSVRISQGFYLSKFPITVAQFRRFADAELYVTEAETEKPTSGKGALTVQARVQRYVAAVNWRNLGFQQQDQHPVVAVSWNDSLAFADWLSRKTQGAVRLPTEAEWEYAARGPQERQWPWGNTWVGTKCNHADVALKVAGIMPETHAGSSDSDGFVYTSPAGQFDNASWCGARDMAGNVWQWCQDWYGKKYYPLSPANDPTGPRNGDSFEYTFGGVSLPGKTLRGGSFLDTMDMCRATARIGAPAVHRAINIGFRIVVVPPRKNPK